VHLVWKSSSFKRVISWEEGNPNLNMSISNYTDSEQTRFIMFSKMYFWRGLDKTDFHSIPLIPRILYLFTLQGEDNKTISENIANWTNFHRIWEVKVIYQTRTSLCEKLKYLNPTGGVAVDVDSIVPGGNRLDELIYKYSFFAGIEENCYINIGEGIFGAASGSLIIENSLRSNCRME
jgi:hypothetical protein